ncbi:fructose-6-phosphate aldolase [Candidatus Gracilibacteria bacterium]|nr:fructose-6-phosphate aldolase [Candidatus Gracilibacteria bacterium]MCF7819331.1 fructose-6-phosphate aldolase [Candidatus Gracilibacteria bacterium]
MQFFLDTADIDAIKKYASWGIVDGITTNPTLISKEGVDLKTRIQEIAEIIDGPISSEVVATDSDGMVEQGRKMAKWHKNVTVKIPMTSEGLKAVKILSAEGIKINVTLVFSVPQAMMAAKAGADFVSPFLGRVDDISSEGIELVADIVDVFQNYGIQTKVLAASIRHPLHVVQAMKVGADIATMPPAVFDKLVSHPLTDQGLEKFLSDWEKCKSCQKEQGK